MKKLNKVLTVLLGIALVFGVVGLTTTRAAGPAIINLGSAANYMVLAKTAITTTGVTSITGDIGISPAFSTNTAGFSLVLDGSGTFSTSALVSGRVYAANYTAPTPNTLTTAVSAMEAAYTDGATRTPGVGASNLNLGGGTLSGHNLVPGTYTWGSNVSITNDITFTGSASDVWILQISGNLSIEVSKKIVLAGGALPQNIFWVVAGTTTLKPGSTFNGIILAGPGASTIAMQSGATLYGRALGQTDVTLIGNTITAVASAPAPATLRVVKTVINDNGGTAVASNFNLHVKLSGSDVAGSPAVGIAAPGTSYSLSAGTYVVSEDANASYARSFSGDCDASGNIILASGDSKTCTITNNDIASAPAPATLRVVKTVINDNGGTAVASNFTLNVSGTNVSPSSFVGSVAGVDVTLDAGSYAVTEPTVPTGYLQTGSGDCSGTIAAGQTKTCTITNDDIAPQLVVNKIVVNENGGTKVISDFPLFIDGNSVASGVASITTTGLHTVSEISNSGYTATIGGNCATDGTITLALGDVKTCTITNDDIAPVVVPPSSGGIGSGIYYASVPPIIDVVKVPSPLALPDGPGSVKYTYTLRNIGTVPANNITMVGDTCSPIALISGDTNSDAKLDVNETWIYACSATLTKTHTNIVTATGWANGISATDIANATVIVGIPVVPPLIHVTKIPNPLVLSAGGGMVTYTNKVTNPGTVALSNVRLADDKCGPVKYISGDTNGNSKLETTETWTYICSAKLTKTTVNTVTASGEANGLTAKDFAIVTVVVSAVPKLPNTGLPTSNNTIPWNIIAPAGIFAILASFYFARRKQTA